jgi:hypothetical protein
MFFYCFKVLILKLKFKIYIILIYFQIKNTLKTTIITAKQHLLYNDS